MDLSSSSSSTTTPATAKATLTSIKPLNLENSIESINNDTAGSNSLYDSAMDNMTTFVSFTGKNKPYVGQDVCLAFFGSYSSLIIPVFVVKLLFLII